MGRNLTFEIFRYNPLDPHSQPHMQTFNLEEHPSMTLFIALNMIRETQDASLQFDFCCRAGICGSCGMVINGRPGLACHTQTCDLPARISLHPLPVFKLLGDLSVDTGTWFRHVGKKIESWIHTNKAFDPDAQEERMDNELATQIFELDRCIECGCCVAACGTARMREDFIGATANNRMARFSAAWACWPATTSAPNSCPCRTSWASCAAWCPPNPCAGFCRNSCAKSSRVAVAITHGHNHGTAAVTRRPQRDDKPRFAGFAPPSTPEPSGGNSPKGSMPC